MSARRAILAALLVALAASPVTAQDAGRRDGGPNDGGPRDGGSIDGGARDGGPLEAGTGTVPGPTADEQPPPEEVELPEGHRPEITLRIEPREGLVTGDVVHVVVTVRLPEGDDVAVPRQTFEPFELHAQRHHDVPVDGERREFTFEIDLLALEPGQHELPALRLRVVTADGTVATVLTEPQPITIGSLIANEPDAQPRPATQPLPVMQEDYTLAWILGIFGGMLLTALLTWLAARWWNRRPKKAAPLPPPRPAWVTALAKLDALRNRSARLLEDGQHVELVDGVSDALREYLGARYDFNGLESTTDEVIARVRDVRLQGVTVTEITSLLGDGDLVKFAKAVPSQEQCEEMIAGAVRIVRGTIPSAAPAISPAARAPAPRPSSGGAPAKPAEPAPTKPAEAAPAKPAETDGAARIVTKGGGPIIVPLVIDAPAAIDAIVSATVMGTVAAKAGEPSWDGTIVVALSEDLPDEYASRAALRAVHEKLATSLDGKRPGGVRVVIEHFHESLREKGAGARKSVYGPGAGEETRPSDIVPAPSTPTLTTPTGNAFDDPGKGGES